jgi:hypothetical protein
LFVSDVTATADLPPQGRSGRLLSLVRKLIDYGTQLAASFRQRPAPNDPRHLTRLYGTSDIAVILARIAQGLLRARLLSEKVTSTATRLDHEPPPNPAPSPRTSRAVPSTAAQPRAPRRQPEPPLTDTASLLARLPTPDQIAAKIRRQKIGAVLADICRDLGIPPSHELWDELQSAIREYGGNSSRLYFDWLEQAFPIRHILAGFKARSEVPPEPASTGPPLAIPA